MRLISMVLCLILAASLLWAGPADDAEKREGAKALVTADRLLIRETQLMISQAYIARLQAEAQVRQTEDNLTRVLESLKAQYACLDCELNADFTWVRKPAPSPETATIPAPNKASGQTSNKE